MDRYPHKCVILEPPEDKDNPYAQDNEYREVYSGSCRCYNNNLTTYRTSKIMNCDFCLSIPNPRMVDIGENFKVLVKYPNIQSENEWNLVGYVKDFVRYDRNCEVYFQMIKENLVEGDIPNYI